MARVIIGLSGGVDSSVAAWMLKKQGHEVIGLFMKNWHDDSVTISDECPWLEDSNDALMVAQKLGIPFQTIDLSEEYKARIVDYMFAEYECGRTPNPDVLCNREIKFDVFLDAALKLGADFVATGHYCRKSAMEKDGQTVYRLLAGKDGNKDQSYFLCQLNQFQLSKALFPIGELTKPEVREIARKQELATAGKKDSQGLCFVGKIRLPEFLQQQLKPKKGEIIEIPERAPALSVYHENAQLQKRDHNSLKQLTAGYPLQKSMGEVVGEHQGAHFFTIGQRKGLQVGGKPQPLFVIGTDVAQNLVFTGQGAAHPGLNRFGLRVAPSDVHWVRDDLRLFPGQKMEVLARIRYRQPLQKAVLFMEEDFLFVIFEEAQKGITPGQFVAWYADEELLGSGTIA